MRGKKLGVAGAAALLLFAGGLVASGAPASLHSSHAAKAVQATAVSVVAGKPGEFAMTISRTSIRPGTAVFTVTNKGLLTYSFTVCPTGGRADACQGGVSTPVVDPGRTAKLTVNLAKGNHEYILTSDFYATDKGTITATASAAAGTTTKVTGTTSHTTTSKPKTTTSKTTTKTSTTSKSTTTSKTTTTSPATATTPSGGGAPLIGDPVAGAAVFKSAGCGSCHTLKAAGSTGTAGPNLDEIAPDQPTVVTNVTYGNAMGMPAFGGPGGSLSSTQINNVAAYVYSSTH